MKGGKTAPSPQPPKRAMWKKKCCSRFKIALYQKNNLGGRLGRGPTPTNPHGESSLHRGETHFGKAQVGPRWKLTI